jgi:hypothetical protein
MIPKSHAIAVWDFSLYSTYVVSAGLRALRISQANRYQRLARLGGEEESRALRTLPTSRPNKELDTAFSGVGCTAVRRYTVSEERVFNANEKAGE